MQNLIYGKKGKFLFPFIVAGALSACGGGGSDTDIVERDPIPNPNPVDPTPEPHASGARLLVTGAGDHDHIVVFDLEEKVAIADLHVEGKVSGLHASPSHRYAIVIQGTQGAVNFIDSGVESEAHGDHVDVHLTDPAVLDFSLAGTKPAHVTKHQDQIVIFFDGAEGVPAEIRVVTETGINEASTLAEYTDSINQHGAAQAWGNYLVSTVRDGNVVPATTLPSMVKISERHDSHYDEVETLDTPDHACPGLHGSAQNSGFIIFGCNDGVLVLEQHDDHFDAHKIANATRISGVFGHANVTDFVGTGRNASDDPVSMFAVNPATETITPIVYDRTPRAYGFAENGELFLILDTDGGVTALDTQNWTVAGARLQVTAAAEAAEQVFRMTISADGEHAYIADTGAQRILAVEMHDWEVDSDATLQLDFTPGPILWLGSAEEGGSHLH